jgi:multidrug resistance protein MdtO
VLAPLLLLGAWIATGSERSSYIGTQMIVTFALATLENAFGPVYDLVEIRDRAVGILIGTAVSAVVYTFIWPESEASALPQKLAGALGTLGKLLRLPQHDPAMQRTYLQLRIGCHAAFNACEEMRERVALELQLNDDERSQLLARSDGVIHHGREILYRCDGLTQPEPPLAETLEHYAAGLASNNMPSDRDTSSTLSEQAQCVMQQIARLPDWNHPAPTAAGEQAQGATSQ